MKSLDSFSNDKTKSDGKYPSCKDCKKTTDKKYRETHLEQRRQTDKKYYQSNSSKIKERSNKWYNENKERHLERMRQYYKENYSKIKSTQKKWDDLNKDKIREYFRMKYNTDINHRIKQRINGRLRSCVKTKKNSSFSYLSCDIEFFKQWIEYQFDDNMSWDNIGKWHFDHVIPCASYDLTDEKQILECYHWSNIRPLWCSENCSKGCKVLKDIIDNHKMIVKQFIQLHDVPKIVGNNDLAEI
jgi:hypothetical protein